MKLRLKSTSYFLDNVTACCWSDGALPPRTRCQCAKNGNVLKAVKTNLVFGNHSWDFLHFPNAGVTLSLIAAEKTLSYIFRLSDLSCSGSPLDTHTHFPVCPEASMDKLPTEERNYTYFSLHVHTCTKSWIAIIMCFIFNEWEIQC